jgi:perosamine synthetase
MMKRQIPIAIPSTGEEEWLATRECFESGWLTQGPKVAEFEREFALRHGVEAALAVTSCTTGLHLALAAIGIGPGDEVLVPAFTWVATANVVLYCGATPVFVDVDPVTYNMDPKKISSKVTDRTKAVIPVHLFGRCADMDAIRSALPAGVAIIEDAACAAGASYKGKPAGSLGDVGVFSFHPRKSITTGEGGMVTTNDVVLAETLLQLRSHGASISEEQRHNGPHPYLLPAFDKLGFNYRMTDLQGAVGLVQLSKLDTFISERAHWADFYTKALSDIEWLTTPVEPVGRGAHAWQAYVCRVDPTKTPDSRNVLMDRLHLKGVSTRPGTHAVPYLGYYQKTFEISPEDYPVAYALEKETLAIPLHNRMSEEDYHYVVEELHALQGVLV